MPENKKQKVAPYKPKTKEEEIFRKQMYADSLELARESRKDSFIWPNNPNISKNTYDSLYSQEQKYPYYIFSEDSYKADKKNNTLNKNFKFDDYIFDLRDTTNKSVTGKNLPEEKKSKENFDAKVESGWKTYIDKNGNTVEENKFTDQKYITDSRTGIQRSVHTIGGVKYSDIMDSPYIKPDSIVYKGSINKLIDSELNPSTIKGSSVNNEPIKWGKKTTNSYKNYTHQTEKREYYPFPKQKILNADKDAPKGEKITVNNWNKIGFQKKAELPVDTVKPVIQQPKVNSTFIPPNLIPKEKVQSYTAAKALQIQGKPSGYINQGDGTGRKEIKRNGGWLDSLDSNKFQNGGKTKTYTNKLEFDKANKAYQDSLNLFNTQNKFNADFINNFKVSKKPSNIPVNIWDEIVKAAKSIPAPNNKTVQTIKNALTQPNGDTFYENRPDEGYPRSKFYVNQAKEGKVKLREGNFTPNNIANQYSIGDIIFNNDTKNATHKRNISTNNNIETIQDYTIDSIRVGLPFNKHNETFYNYGFKHQNIIDKNIKPVSILKFNQDVNTNETRNPMIDGGNPKSNSYSDKNVVNIDLPIYKKPTDKPIYQPDVTNSVPPIAKPKPNLVKAKPKLVLEPIKPLGIKPMETSVEAKLAGNTSVTQSNYNKPLYQDFVKTANQDYLGPDYNLEEAYKNLPYNMMQAWAKDPENNHLPDTYKLPNHPTFSNESIYYKPGMKAVKWVGDNPVNIETQNYTGSKALKIQGKPTGYVNIGDGTGRKEIKRNGGWLDGLPTNKFQNGGFKGIPSNIPTSRLDAEAKEEAKRMNPVWNPVWNPVNNSQTQEVYQQGPKKGTATGKGALEPSYPELMLMPGSLPIKAASKLGKAAVVAAEVLNPIGGMRNLKNNVIGKSAAASSTIGNVLNETARPINGHMPGTPEWIRLNDIITSSRAAVAAATPKNSKLIHKAKELERNITIPILNSKPALKVRKAILNKINENSVVSNSAFTPENLEAFKKSGLIHGEEGTLVSKEVASLYSNAPAGQGKLRAYLRGYLNNKQADIAETTFHSPNRSFSSYVSLPSDTNPVGKFENFGFFSKNPISAGKTAVNLNKLISNIPGKWDFNPGSLSGDSYPIWAKIVNDKASPQFELINKGLTGMNTLGKHSKISKLLETNMKNGYNDPVKVDEFLKELEKIAGKTADKWNVPKESLMPDDTKGFIPDLSIKKKYKNGGKLNNNKSNWLNDLK